MRLPAFAVSLLAVVVLSTTASADEDWSRYDRDAQVWLSAYAHPTNRAAKLTALSFASAYFWGFKAGAGITCPSGLSNATIAAATADVVREGETQTPLAIIRAMPRVGCYRNDTK